MQPIYLDQEQLYKQRRAFRIKFYLGIFVLLLFSLFIFYVIVYSPIFTARDFKIVGAERLSDGVILQTLEPFFLSNRIKIFLGMKNLLAWGEKDDLDLTKTAILDVNIRRDWIRQSVTINVKERGRLAIWCGLNSCYWIDEEGTAFEEAPHTEGSLILTINSDTDIVFGRQVIEERFVKNLISILKEILAAKIPVEKMNYNKRLQEISVETYSGPDLFLSVRFDPTLNLSSFRSLKEKSDLSRVKYVDLRVENRIFYKNL